MITFKSVVKRFKSDFWAKEFVALQDVSFSIKEGEITGFLGANGAGKTTSLKIMMNFIKATSGSVSFSKTLGKTQKKIFKAFQIDHEILLKT